LREKSEAFITVVAVYIYILLKRLIIRKPRSIKRESISCHNYSTCHESFK